MGQQAEGQQAELGELGAQQGEPGAQQGELVELGAQLGELAELGAHQAGGQQAEPEQQVPGGRAQGPR